MPFGTSTYFSSLLMPQRDNSHNSAVPRAQEGSIKYGVPNGTIPQERVNAVKHQLANYRKFRDLTQEWVNLALELCKLNTTQPDQD